MRYLFCKNSKASFSSCMVFDFVWPIAIFDFAALFGYIIYSWRYFCFVSWRYNNSSCVLQLSLIRSIVLGCVVDVNLSPYLWMLNWFSPIFHSDIFNTSISIFYFFVSNFYLLLVFLFRVFYDFICNKNVSF